MAKVKVKAKLENYKDKKLTKLIRQQEVILLSRIAKMTKKIIRSEVPVDKGNLKDSTLIEKAAEVGDRIGLNVGTDEDKAPYAPYVYWPAGLHGLGTKTDRKRKWAGNDWIGRSLPKAQSRASRLVADAFKEFNGIQI